MKVKNNSLIFVTIFICCCVMSSVGFFLSTKDDEQLRVKDFIKNFPIYITAKHIPVDSVEKETGYKFLYAEEGTDRSFYYNPEYKYTVYPVGTNVVIDNSIQGKVIESKSGLIKVSVDDTSLIYKGLSGSSVKSKDSGETIAFVSAMDKDLSILCYTYN